MYGNLDRQIFALEIQNSAQGIRNPADGGNLEPSTGYSNFESEIPGLESRIHSREILHFDSINRLLKVL